MPRSVIGQLFSDPKKSQFRTILLNYKIKTILNEMYPCGKREQIVGPAN